MPEFRTKPPFIYILLFVCFSFLVSALYLNLRTNAISSPESDLLLPEEEITRNRTQREISSFVSSLYQKIRLIGSNSPTPTKTLNTNPTSNPAATPTTTSTGLALTPLPTTISLPDDINFPTPTPTSVPSPTPAPDCIADPYELCFFDLDNTTDPINDVRYAPVDNPTKNTIIDTLSYLKVEKSILDNYAIVVMQDKDYGGMDVFVVAGQLRRPVGTLEYEHHLAVDSSRYKIIQLNTTLSGGDLSATVCHTVGRIVWTRLTASEQTEYENLRSPSDQELLDDFAEVFKYIFGDKTQDSNLWDVRTSSANPDQQTVDFMQETVAPKFR